MNSSIEVRESFVCRINEQVASVLVGNLVKNAFVHSVPGDEINISVSADGFSVRNHGEAPLDKERVFHRFYLPGGRREGSTGLGLALAYSVCERSGLSLTYDFQENQHIFSVILKK
jgi:signal transduction histidine kinase